MSQKGGPKAAAGAPSAKAASPSAAQLPAQIQHIVNNLNKKNFRQSVNEIASVPPPLAPGLQSPPLLPFMFSNLCFFKLESHCSGLCPSSSPALFVLSSALSFPLLSLPHFLFLFFISSAMFKSFQFSFSSSAEPKQRACLLPALSFLIALFYLLPSPSFLSSSISHHFLQSLTIFFRPLY